jgi:hypothetical protein
VQTFFFFFFFFDVGGLLLLWRVVINCLPVPITCAYIGKKRIGGEVALAPNSLCLFGGFFLSFGALGDQHPFSATWIRADRLSAQVRRRERFSLSVPHGPREGACQLVCLR